MAAGVEQRTVTNTADLFRGKDGIFVVVSKTTSLFNESGRQAVRVTLVVDQLGVDVVVDIPSILQSCGATEHVVTNSTEERLRSLRGGFELAGSVYLRDVRLESL